MSLSVVLVTRDRPRQAARAVESILTAPGDFELVVVDQSQHPTPLPYDERLRFLHLPGQGLSRGRNQGLSAARHELIACTDDDCAVGPDWPALAASLLGQEPRVGMVFGEVRPAWHDVNQSLVPAHRARRTRATSLWEKNRVEGMGACMLLRRSMVLQLGGFDEGLGAGARIPAGEELDLALRALASGWWILERPELYVLHQGIRSREEGPALVRAYWRGTGAVFAKQLRCGRWPVLFLLAGLGFRFLVRGSAVGQSLRAGRLDRLRAFVQGGWEGLRSPLERGLFQAPPASPPAPPPAGSEP